MSAAQEEYDSMFNKTDHLHLHPEDAAQSPTPVLSDDETTLASSHGLGKDSSDEDEEDDPKSRKPSKYYLPAHRQDHSTGPKGVIADAQAFERAKYGSRSTYARTKDLALPKRQLNGGTDNELWDLEKGSEDFDDDFMQKWREDRLRELKGPEKPSKISSRGPYGRMDAVDGLGYLDAIENSPPSTVVVVYIYDRQSQISAHFESFMTRLAQKHATVKFIKMDYEEAGIEVAGVPQVLAYQNGDKFAGIIPLVEEVPFTCNVITNLEDALKRHRILS